MTPPTRDIPPDSPLSADPRELLETALRHAAAGRPVFPCVPNAKRPLTPHGLLDATTDERRIRAWWRRTPTANIGLPTGAPSFDVLDVDWHPTGSGYPALRRLLQADLATGNSHLIATPSGGRHLYFAGTDQRSSALPSGHLDFKAVGGYVIAPPSVVNGRPYRFLHQGPDNAARTLNWPTVRDLLTPPKLLLRPPTTIPLVGIEPLANWVARLPEGHRNRGTFWASCRAVEQGITDLRPILDAAVTAGLPRTEASRTINSAIRRGDAGSASTPSPAAAPVSSPIKRARPRPRPGP